MMEARSSLHIGDLTCEYNSRTQPGWTPAFGVGAFYQPTEITLSIADLAGSQMHHNTVMSDQTTAETACRLRDCNDRHSKETIFRMLALAVTIYPDLRNTIRSVHRLAKHVIGRFLRASAVCSHLGHALAA